MSTEKAIFYARAVVYYFDPKTRGWTPTTVGANFCRVDMYENSATNSYRVIGRGLQDTTKVVINSTLAKDTAYTRASETFHQWSDLRYIYGLNFVTKEEAESFGSGFERIVNQLKGGGGSMPPPPAAPAAPMAPSNTGSLRGMTGSSSNSGPPSAPTPPAAPPAPTPPSAPTPPAAPSAPSSSSGGPPPPPSGGPPPPPAPAASKPPADSGGRAGLLGAISGFNAGKLKKVETVDKSGPILKAEPAAASGGARGGGGGGGNMMDAILNARKNIVKNTGSPVPKKEPAPAPAPAPTPAKQPMNIPVKAPLGANRTSSSSFNSGNVNPVKPQVEAPAPSHSSHGGSSVSSEELRALKEEILAEMRKEIQQAKDEILAALYNR